jgi:putative SOS response-associated peptidase YedK
MCGRFSLYEPTDRLVDRFSVDEVVAEEIRPRWNVAPSQPVLAVNSSKDGEIRRLGTLRWGLVPWWADDPSIGNRLINARAETLSIRRAFRSAFERRRCLIPANGFYEWKQLEGPGRRRARHQPFYIHSVDGSPLALGGLWEVWHDAEGRSLHTCTIITTEPNAAVAAVHDRMPLLVPAGSWDRWLAPEPLADREQATLLAPASDGLLVLDPVSTMVNSPRNEGPELIEPVPLGDQA